MSHVTYVWVISQMNILIRVVKTGCRVEGHQRHVTYKWVMVLINGACHIWMNHGTHMNESCHAHKWVMSHIWMSHNTHEWVMFHKRIRVPVVKILVPVVKTGCQVKGYQRYVTYEWVMSHINESCHICLSHFAMNILIPVVKTGCQVEGYQR